MKKGTIIRTILFVIVIINMILKAAGKDALAVTENDVAITVETAIEIAILIAAWWKNNSFTKNAQEADKLLEKLNSMKED